MSLSSYILRKFLSNPREALRIKKAGDEIREYAVWRIYTQLEMEGILQSLQTQAWWSFKDQVLAKLLCDALVEEGLAAWEGDRIKLKRSPEKPAVTTIEAADMLPVIDRAAEALPRALLLGEKPSRDKTQALTAKLLDNFAVKLEFEAAIDEAGLGSLKPGSTIADIHPRVGTSTLTLLERTKASIVVIEPYQENIEITRRLVELHGQESRVSFVHSTPEEAELPEKVDAIFMGQLVHWIPSPRLAIANARRMLKDNGILAMAQTTYSSVGLIMSVPGYLLGAVQAPPESGELRRILTGSGFKIEKWLESLGIALVKASPS
ncbi:MAG: methyltransferase domain-containing protein [Thermofilaceae archaeon]